MLYLFEDTATGEPVEVWYPMAEAPELGSIVEHEGRRLKRRPSALQVVAEPDFRHVAYSLRQKGDTPEHLQADVPHWTDEGPCSKPLFINKQEILEFNAKTDGAFAYDLRPKIQQPIGA